MAEPLIASTETIKKKSLKYTDVVALDLVQKLACKWEREEKCVGGGCGCFSTLCFLLFSTLFFLSFPLSFFPFFLSFNKSDAAPSLPSLIHHGINSFFPLRLHLSSHRLIHSFRNDSTDFSFLSFISFQRRASSTLYISAGIRKQLGMPLSRICGLSQMANSK